MLRVKRDEKKTEILGFSVTRKQRKDLLYFAAKYDISLSFLVREVMKTFLAQEQENLLKPVQTEVSISQETFEFNEGE